MTDGNNSSPDFSDARRSGTTAASSNGGHTIIVKAGDNLPSIAKRELGDPTRWRAIYEANRHQIADPDLIHPGVVLTIPASP